MTASKLSSHFSYDELTKTSVRMSNEPGPQELENLKELCKHVLEPCRELIGPMWITSGYRSWMVNTRIGGSPSSQHCKGQAADFIAMTRDLKSAFLTIMESLVPYDQLIFEVPNGLGRGWIHISYNNHKDTQRKQVLMCLRPGKFEPFDLATFDEVQ